LHNPGKSVAICGWQGHIWSPERLRRPGGSRRSPVDRGGSRWCGFFSG